MAACEKCWTEASRRAAYSAESVVDLYPKVLKEHEGWPPHDAPCGGVGTNGADPKCCEVHMLPWGHKREHPHEEATDA